ncbi:RNA polymerase III, large subunit, partial [Trachipleistophora hominis]
VTEFNIQSLRKCVLNGPKRYPGANFIINKENKRISTWYNKRILIGDVVERHLIDNDRVLFNRQPSLHRLSILSHFAKIVPNKTFCFNVSVCAPYNADFDGDEMNVHVPQTLFARAECSLMRIKENLRSPKDNQLIIMPNQDFITSVYLIGNEYFDEMSFSTYLFEVCHASKDYEMARKIRPSILRPTRIYTGQQLLGTIFKKHGPFKTLITKKMLKQYLSEMSNEEIVIAENSIARVSARFIGERGFSIGVDDLEYKNEENKMIGIKTLIREYVEEMDSDNIAELSSVRDKISKTIKLIPDNSALIMAESGSKGSKINITQMVAMVGQQVINGQRVPLSYSGRSLPHYFDKEVNITGLGRTAENEPGNSSRLSTTCSNTSVQMAGICGQTSDQKNENVGDTMNNRFISSCAMDDSLPCTDNLKHVPEAESKAKKIGKKDSDEEKMLFRGFIKNSFFTGLNAFEFFFHAISGREGLVDTAVKTAETGYMQRRLIKALEDLKLCFDGSVRGTDCVIQFPDSNSSYFRKGFQPGDAVGAIAAQSIGEPGTQMTLKTFHFAGVGSMNITLGVPRLKEIINASACSTPVIRISGRRKTLSDMRRLNDLIQPLRIENVIDYVDINISENIYVDFRTKAKYRSLNKTMQERLEKRYKNETFIHNDGVRMYLDVNQDSIYTLNDMKLQVGKVFLRGIGTITGTVFNNVERESIDGAGNKSGVNTKSSPGDEKCKRTRKDSLRYVMMI